MANNILTATQSNINLANDMTEGLKAFPIYSGLGCFLSSQSFDTDVKSIGIYPLSEIMIDDIVVIPNTTYYLSLEAYDCSVSYSIFYYKDNSSKNIPLTGSQGFAFSDQGVSPQWNLCDAGATTAPENATLARLVITNPNRNNISITRIKMDTTNVAWSEGITADPVSYTNNDIFVETPDMWYKLYADYSERHNNVFDGAAIQTRIMGQSQNIISSPFDTSYSLSSEISEPIEIDITAPHISDIEIQPNYMGQSSRIHVTTDSVEIPFAFRIGYTITDGSSYTNWMPWSEFISNVGTSKEVVFDLDHANFFDLTTNKPVSANRRIWAQVIDAVGNLSQSDTISATIYNVAKTDFEPPVGQAEFVSQSGVTTELTNTTNLYLKLNNVYDKATDIKDLRYRDIIDSTSTWSNWINFDSAIPFILENTNGLHRLEIQLRDYGNNITVCDSLYDLLLKSSDTNINTVFNTGATMNNEAYLAGIKSKVFETLELEKYSNTAFGTGKIGYYVKKQGIDSVIPLKKHDRIPPLTIAGQTYTPYYAGDTPASRYCYIDESTGVLVFGGISTPSSTTITLTGIKIYRETAVLYKWDKKALYKIADFGFADEQAILSLYSTDNTLYIGTLSGNLYSYTNDILSNSIYAFTDIDNTILPVTLITEHQFAHETEPYLYVGTGTIAHLFRSPLSNAKSGTSWEVIGHGQFASNDLLCATSAYNKIFIGTNNSKVVIYERTKSTDLVNTTSTDTEIWSTKTLYTEDIPIVSICASGNQVLAGAGTRPEVWSYSEDYINLPKTKAKYITIPLNDKSKDEPNAWEYYSNGLTVNPNNIVYTPIYDMFSPNQKKYVKEITGNSNSVSILKLNKNSVWEKSLQKLFANNTTYPKWTFEIEMMNKSGTTDTSRQGFRLSDGKTTLDIMLSVNDIYIRSGNNFDTYNYKTNNNVSLFSNQEVTNFTADGISAGGFGYPLNYNPNYTGQASSDLYMYPLQGIKKIWNFAATDNKENYGPYYATVESGNADIQGWTSNQFSLNVATDNINSLYRTLKINVADLNNPRITKTCDTDDIFTNTHSKIYIRCRYGNETTNTTSFDNAKLKIALSSDKYEQWNNPTWMETQLVSTTDFATYKFSPSYNGKINAIAVEFDGLPETNRQDYIYIDYIAIADDTDMLNPIDITNNLVPIRVCVEYDLVRVHNRVRVWIGKSLYPVFDKQDFLVSVIDTQSISIGKLNILVSEINPTLQDSVTLESDSVWIYGTTRFATNIAEAPLETKTNDFKLLWKHLSTDGISKIVNHKGTTWTVTNGLLNIDGTSTDNPLDAWIKVYAFDPNNEVWIEQNNNINKKCNLISALTVVPLDSNLIIAGEESSDFDYYDESDIISPIIFEN